MNIFNTSVFYSPTEKKYIYLCTYLNFINSYILKTLTFFKWQILKYLCNALYFSHKKKCYIGLKLLGGIYFLFQNLKFKSPISFCLPKICFDATKGKLQIKKQSELTPEMKNNILYSFFCWLLMTRDNYFI